MWAKAALHEVVVQRPFPANLAIDRRGIRLATTNRWGRAIGAGVLAELAIIVVIGLTMLIYTMTGTRSAADKMAFIHDAAA